MFEHTITAAEANAGHLVNTATATHRVPPAPVVEDELATTGATWAGPATGALVLIVTGAGALAITWCRRRGDQAEADTMI